VFLARRLSPHIPCRSLKEQFSSAAVLTRYLSPKVTSTGRNPYHGQVAIDALASVAATARAGHAPSSSGESASQRRLLEGCTLYVTCEPCIMCAAALAQLGLERAVFG